MPRAATKQKPPSPRGKTATHHKLIKRLFNGLPVVDAKRETIIHAIASDIKSAKRGDALNCVFAKACQRLFGSRNTAFFRAYAYVERDNRVERYALPKATRDSVMVFDKAGKAEPGGYLLKPPAPAQMLDYKVEYQRNHPPQREHWPSNSGKKRKKAKDVDFRTGTGLVQFLRAEIVGEIMTARFTTDPPLASADTWAGRRIEGTGTMRWRETRFAAQSIKDRQPEIETIWRNNMARRDEAASDYGEPETPHEFYRGRPGSQAETIVCDCLRELRAIPYGDNLYAHELIDAISRAYLTAKCSAVRMRRIAALLKIDVEMTQRAARHE